MGAAHSASEEVRELEGKTGCEYHTEAGHPRGDRRLHAPASRRRAV